MNRKKIVIESIDTDQALKYLGYGANAPDKNISEYIDRCENLLLQTIKPEYIYKVFDLSDRTEVIGADFNLEGNAIKRHLKGCEKVVFLCATVSGDVDKLIRKTQISDMTSAVIMDSMASAAVEQVCDKIEEVIGEEFPNYNMTWRFGLGYEDFPLTLQRKFLELLDAPKRTGVCVSESGMLTPVKSVTCLIGLSRQKTLTEKHCDNCFIKETCGLRAKGEHCYK